MVILDEGTSAVGMQTADDIENKLLKMSHLTLITITHNLRKELLESYDSIIFMEDGRIIEDGSFDELIQRKSAFYNYFTLKIEKKDNNAKDEENGKDEV